jgi:hypothetical protein
MGAAPPPQLHPVFPPFTGSPIAVLHGDHKLDYPRIGKLLQHIAAKYPTYISMYMAGWLDGRRDEREVWTPIVKMGYYGDRTTVARSTAVGPCASRCQACTTCVRWERVFFNRRMYGSDDYPGGPVPTW